MAQTIVEFGDLIKSFRERYELTQEKFTQIIYDFDSAEFDGVDTVTLSRWERLQSRPSKARQLKLFKAMQSHAKCAFPLWFDEDTELENNLCHIGTQNLIGRSSYLVFDIPQGMMKHEHVTINQLRDMENYEDFIPFLHALHKDHTEDALALTPEHFREWALHPTSLFLMAVFYNQVCGVLLLIRLKVEVAEALKKGWMHLNEVKATEHLADFGEKAVVWPFMFFGYSMSTGSLLLLRYYAHLIANQNDIVGVGAFTAHEGGRKLVERLYFKTLDVDTVNENLNVHYAPLDEMLATKEVLEMVFKKSSCEEE